MVHAMIGHPGSLYFTGMGPDSNSLMFVARKTFLGMFIFLFLVHMSFKILHKMALVGLHQEMTHLFALD